ncbi:MAG: ABC transporter ATP-binding protein [Lactovum sp.]
MAIININHLTKDYGHQRGNFNVSLQVEKGMVYGYLGPNGAGKTTTIRHIMGFSKADSGSIEVNGKNSWLESHEIQKEVGYLPGEISFPENLTGKQFIEYMAKLRNIKDLRYARQLSDKFQLDSSSIIKRMSLGTKRKLAIITAFMHDPKIFILDEPTSGLDPIMQDLFIQFILEEKKKGKTILLSSHIFSEIDACCDIISIIKDGVILSTFKSEDLRKNHPLKFKVEFNSQFDNCLNSTLFSTFNSEVRREKNQIIFEIEKSNIRHLIDFLSDYPIKFISEIPFTLENYFMNFYDRSNTEKEQTK